MLHSLTRSELKSKVTAPAPVGPKRLAPTPKRWVFHDIEAFVNRIYFHIKPTISKKKVNDY